MSTQPGRGGFALLAVLWVIMGIAVLGLAVSLTGRSAVATATNRTDLLRAGWRAEDCLARARAVIADVLTGRAVDAFGYPVDWGDLKRIIPSARLLDIQDCALEVRPSGVSLDVNAADAEMLHNLFSALGAHSLQADSLADAILDWRDTDTIPRPLGAEKDWYESHERHPPRDGPFASVRELRRVRGLENFDQVEPVLGVDSGAISLEYAPHEVLAAIPGFGFEAVTRVVELRKLGSGRVALPAVAGRLSPSAQRRLMARYGDAARITVTEPDAWFLTARGWAGVPPVTVVVELKLARAGTRAAIIRRRTWLE